MKTISLECQLKRYYQYFQWVMEMDSYKNAFIYPCKNHLVRDLRNISIRVKTKRLWSVNWWEILNEFHELLKTAAFLVRYGVTFVEFEACCEHFIAEPNLENKCLFLKNMNNIVSILSIVSLSVLAHYKHTDDEKIESSLYIKTICKSKMLFWQRSTLVRRQICLIGRCTRLSLNSH